jgi:Nickel responsive protein SCO4226-like
VSKFVIERDIPGVGAMSPEDLRSAVEKSNEAVSALTPRVQWHESYITDDKLYCVYLAADERAITEHAALSGLPANRISRVSAVVDPTSSET